MSIKYTVGLWSAIKARRHGRTNLTQRRYQSPDELWEECVEYFDWVEANPMIDQTLVTFQGSGSLEAVPKMRAMSLKSLWAFIGIASNTWQEYKQREEFQETIALVEQIIVDQKFTGAAAGLLNATIVQRDLGLGEVVKTDHTSSDGSMSPTKVCPQLVAELTRKLLGD